MTRLGAVAAVVSPILLAPMAAWAADDIPFAITGAVNGTIACRGPGFGDLAPRLSGCRRFDPGRRQVFYSADDNIFTPFGRWGCTIHTNCGESEVPEVPKAEVVFCLSSDRVELHWDGGASLTANQPLICISTLVRSVLGQNGEGDTTPAQDRDTFKFAGKAGEGVEVRLDRDASSGSAGKIATLHVRAPSGAVLAQRTGTVPLSLKLTLPGPVEVAVLRQPSDGEAFRGYYQLAVTPEAGALGDRQLVPSADVEH